MIFQFAHSHRLGILLVGAAVWVIVWLLLPIGFRHPLESATTTPFSLPGFSLRQLVGRPVREANNELLVAEIAAMLRAGVPSGAAWRRAAGVTVDSLGIPDAEQLARLVSPETAAAMVAAARLAVRVGAPLALVLQTVGDALRGDSQMQADRKTALAGPQTTSRVLLALPLLGMLIGWVLGANPITTITGGGVGLISFVAGLALLGVGRWWIAQLVARAAGQQVGKP